MLSKLILSPLRDMHVGLICTSFCLFVCPLTNIQIGQKSRPLVKQLSLETGRIQTDRHTDSANNIMSKIAVYVGCTFPCNDFFV